LLAVAELRRAVGDSVGARAPLDEARTIFVALAAAPACALADALSAQSTAAAAPVLPVRNRHPAGLTGREVEVLRLIAAGKSNRAIAAALCLSDRTIERHITNLYRKIDATNRAGATAYAFRHHLL